MSTLTGFRAFWHRRQKKAALRKRPALLKAKPFVYRDAKKIGLLFPANDSDIRKEVLSFAKSLQKDGRKVELLGFISGVAENVSFDFPYYSEKQLNWCQVPKGESIDAWLKTAFDIVFDFNFKPEPHTDYLVELAQASIKVGLGGDRSDLYELSLDLRQPWSIKKFTQSALQLLAKTNPSHAKSA